jgi:hypothetical protein
MLRISRSLSLLGASLLIIVPWTSSSALVDACRSVVTSNGGIGLVCPFGDGDPLSSYGATITLTARELSGTLMVGVPQTDMWLVGCNDGLILCGGSSGSNADAPTNALGQTTFSNEPAAGGCDTGIYVVVQGIIIQQPGSCQPLCLPIASRSPDYKSAGAPGPAPCAGDIRCPDYKVTMADYSWFSSHYRTSENPGAGYFPCADYAQPFGLITLADFSAFVMHYAGTGHKCPI